MAEVIIGMGQLQRRIAAISGTAGGLAVMRTVSADTLNFLGHNVPRKTAHTARQFRAERVTEKSAEITGSKVARWIDEGTGIYGPRHHRITPTTKRALSWTGGTFGRAGSLRLSGRRRSGKAGTGANRITVRSTAGMRPRPFIDRSVTEAVNRNGGMVAIVRQWDEAA